LLLIPGYFAHVCMDLQVVVVVVVFFFFFFFSLHHIAMLILSFSATTLGNVSTTSEGMGASYDQNQCQSPHGMSGEGCTN
jgi:hypothetical protein